MCDARNIREVSALDIDMMGFDFILRASALCR